MLTWLDSRSKEPYDSWYIHQRYFSIFLSEVLWKRSPRKDIATPFHFVVFCLRDSLFGLASSLSLSLNPQPKYSKIFCPHQWWRTFLSLFSSPFRCFIIMLTGVSCVVYCFQPESRVSRCIPSFLPPGFFSRDYDGPGFCHSSESKACDQYLLLQFFFSTEFINSNCNDKCSC